MNNFKLLFRLTIIVNLFLTPRIRIYTNTSQVYKLGLELNWSLKIYKSVWQKISMAYTYAKDIDKNEPLAEIPPLEIRYKANYSCFNNRLKSMLLYRYVLKQERVSNSFGETSSPQFSLLSLNLGYLLFEHINISIKASNILNEDYYERLNRRIKNTATKIYAPGINYIFSINYNF